MVRFKMGALNGVIATEVLVVSKNAVSWLWLTPLLVSMIIGLFVSEPASWSISGGGRELSVEIIRFRTLESDIYSVGTEKWNYILCQIQGRSNFV